MSAKALTALIATKAQPRERSYELADGGGLYLEVMPSGAKYWRWKYQVPSRGVLHDRQLPMH